MDIDIKSGMDKFLAKKKQTRAVNTNHCSALGELCLRKLFYSRTEYDKAKPVGDYLAGIYKTGKLLEPVIKHIAQSVGMESVPQWRVIAEQTAVNDKLFRSYNISGTKDGFLQTRKDGFDWETVGVVDYKTMSDNVFKSINDFDDLKRYPWTKKYIAQGNLYALADNVEGCMLVCINKQNLGQMKLIWIPLDMEYCERLLSKAEAVNKAVDTKIPPEKINEPDVCDACTFKSICCPEYTATGGLEILNNGELVDILDELDELDDTRKHINNLAKRRDALLEKGKNVVIGDYVISWKLSQTHYKAKPASVTEAWRKTIKKGK